MKREAFEYMNQKIKVKNDVIKFLENMFQNYEIYDSNYGSVIFALQRLFSRENVLMILKKYMLSSHRREF